MRINSGNGFKLCQPTESQRQPSTAWRIVFTDCRHPVAGGKSPTRWQTAIHEPLNLNEGMYKSDESSQAQFCALEYRTPDWNKAGSIILFVFEDANGSLRLFVHPDWRRIILPADVDYIDSLFLDFLERAKLHPENLFKQLCSLGVGPLVTHVTGKSISDHPALSELCSGFVKL
jgi:hypothetical protein